MAKKTTRKAASRRSARSTTKPTARSTRAAAREVTASGKSVRTGVRNLSVDTLKSGDFSLENMPRMVRDVLSGAVDAVDRNIPKSRNNVLREVFDGLSQGINTVNRTGAAILNGRGKKGRGSRGNGRSGRRDTHNDFLEAVSSFASRASRPVREELNSLVDRSSGSRGTRNDGGSNGRSRRKGEHSMMEDAADSVRAGVRSARRTADEMVDAAGDFVNGVMGRGGRGSTRAATKRRRPKPTLGRAVDRAVRKVTKPARKTSKRR